MIGTVRFGPQRPCGSTRAASACRRLVIAVCPGCRSIVPPPLMQEILSPAPGITSIYYNNPDMLAHLLAGMQYAIGDLKADDTPSKKKS